MNEESSEGITLKSTAYGENKILTIFSEEMGIISLTASGLLLKKFTILTNPFCISTFTYKKSKGDIFYLTDGKLLDHLLFLRSSLAFLQTAATLAKCILDSQLPNKKAPLLYRLLKTYLQKIDTLPKDKLITSFQLKVLLHEGVIDAKKECNICKKAIAHYIKDGESVCLEHTSHPSFFFSLQEKEAMQKLIFLKNFTQLHEIDFTKDFSKKINALFTDLIVNN